jgi:hypothetical protein
MALPKLSLFMKLHDYIYNKTKKSKYITSQDLHKLYTMAQALYIELCASHNTPQIVQPQLFVITDYHYRIWELNGPSNLYDEDNIYMYCIYHNRLQFEDKLLNNMPPWYFPASSDENLEPNGTCFKLKVDQIIYKKNKNQ